MSFTQIYTERWFTDVRLIFTLENNHLILCGRQLASIPCCHPTDYVYDLVEALAAKDTAGDARPIDRKSVV